MPFTPFHFGPGAIIKAVIPKYFSFTVFVFANVVDFWPAVVGATLGAYSHVFLDSIMHADIRPLAPFMGGNGLLSLISLSHLHWLCFYLGVLGMMILLIRRAKTALGRNES